MRHRRASRRHRHRDGSVELELQRLQQLVVHQLVAPLQALRLDSPGAQPVRQLVLGTDALGEHQIYGAAGCAALGVLRWRRASECGAEGTPHRHTQHTHTTHRYNNRDPVTDTDMGHVARTLLRTTRSSGEWNDTNLNDGVVVEAGTADHVSPTANMHTLHTTQW